MKNKKIQKFINIAGDVMMFVYFVAAVVCLVLVVRLYIIDVATPTAEAAPVERSAPASEESILPGMVYNADGTPCISAYEAVETAQEVQPIETPTEEQAPRYALTEAERDVIERVVMAEAGAEPYDGQVLIAQCILNAAERSGIRPDEAVVEYQYTPKRQEPTESVKKAVAAVFDDGEQVTAEPVLYFYAPGVTYSTFHESQNFVIEVGGHRFFSEV